MTIDIPKATWALVLLGLLHWSEAVVWAAQGGSMELKVGQPFPEIVLPSLEDSRPSSITQFRGQKLIVHIFASW
jgi:hypothetical protein